MDFFRPYASYRRGFGSLEGEFYLGNDYLHRLTTQDEYELRIDLEDFEGNVKYAVYDLFEIGGVNENYTLRIGEYSGNAGKMIFFFKRRMSIFTSHWNKLKLAILFVNPVRTTDWSKRMRCQILNWFWLVIKTQMSCNWPIRNAIRKAVDLRGLMEE